LDGPSCEQIGSGPLEFPGAGATQRETISLFLDQAVDLIEKVGQLLDLVDEDPCSGGLSSDPSLEAARVSAELKEVLRFQQVKTDGIGKMGSEPSGFPHATWTKKKEALLGLLEQALKLNELRGVERHDEFRISPSVEKCTANLYRWG
jgi:hypothetical protein